MALRITRSRPPKSVSCTVKVQTTVVQGTVDEAQLAEWVSTAIREYHRFRAGHVGIGARSGITVPRVKHVGDQT